MSRILVTYFSASGKTRKAAERIADVLDGDIYEIRPKEPYTAADLNWMDRRSRSTLEMKDKDCRPELADTDCDVKGHDVILTGFPIWWGREPSIVDSFLDAYDFAGKTVIIFATSGGSGMGDTAKRFRQLLGDDVKVIDGKVLSSRISDEKVRSWFEALS